MSGRLQLLREWPPGYGGVERVAHELAEHWQRQGQPCTVFSLAVQRSATMAVDPLPVSYERARLPSLVIGRLALPLPARRLWQVLMAPEPLHAHLPCPAVLSLALLARLLHPKRRISLHWHSFLEPSPTPAGRLYGLYQRLALAALPLFRLVITTSPALAKALRASGMPADRVQVLPCCLPDAVEQAAYAAGAKGSKPHSSEVFRLISIGRLDSYKRVDWVIESLGHLRQREPLLRLQLDVVGDGPDRAALEALAVLRAPGQVQFHGRVDEATKQNLLRQADLLVLAADRSNEAFGIVQLEAMAFAVPALAFKRARSGMHWVSALSCMPWDGTPSELAPTIAMLALSPELHAQARREASQRYRAIFGRLTWLKSVAVCFAADQPGSLQNRQ